MSDLNEMFRAKGPLFGAKARACVLWFVLTVCWASEPTSSASQRWHNAEGGPIQEDLLLQLLRPVGGGIKSSAARHSEETARSFAYSYVAGPIQPGGDLGTVFVDSTEEAMAECSRLIECRGFTFTNSTGARPVTTHN